MTAAIGAPQGQPPPVAASLTVSETGASSAAQGHTHELVRRLLAGDRLSLTRAISRVENRARGAAEILGAVTPHTGHAYTVGITGPPGSGKSTLTTELIRAFRQRGDKVAVVAIDPTSAITGGAILGDRIRMLEFHDDPEVYIRSMASRGQLGGLAATTGDVTRLLDAFGFDWVLIETVGVGQGEVAVAGLADTTLLLEVPGLGDDVQAIKAGVLEVADILVVNKADKDGADRLAATLRTMLNLGQKATWRPPIVKTVAATGSGVPELIAEIERHRRFLQESGEQHTRLRKRLRAQVLDRALEILEVRLARRLEEDPRLAEAMQRLEAREIDPNTLAEDLLRDL